MAKLRKQRQQHTADGRQRIPHLRTLPLGLGTLAAVTISVQSHMVMPVPGCMRVTAVFLHSVHGDISVIRCHVSVGQGSIAVIHGRM